MKCWGCEQSDTARFSLYCQSCQDEAKRQWQAEQTRKKAFRHKGVHYADECATCHRKETVLWIVSFQARNDLSGKIYCPTTGTWCEDCIAGMVGKPVVESGLCFKDIRNIRFIKKCYEPPITKTMLDVCEILKAVGF